MKTRIFLLGVVVACINAAPAIAGSPYVAVNGGASFYSDSDAKAGNSTGSISYDIGYNLNGAVGYKFGNSRTDFEVGYKSATLEGSWVDANVKSYMLNYYYDFKNNSSVTPFLGIGVGLLNGELRYGNYSVDDTTTGYQATAGVAYNFNENVAFDLFYRYQASISDFSKYGTEISYGSSNINGGFRFTF